MAVVLSTSKACPLCREDKMEMQCSQCKTMFDSTTLVTCFHGHRNLHLCIICLYKIFVHGNGSAKYFKCHSHEETALVEVTFARIPNEIKRIILYMSVIRKSALELHQQLLNTNHPKTAEMWWQAAKHFAGNQWIINSF